jgi:HlyD family secretion protein
MLNLLPARVQKTAREVQKRVQDASNRLVGVSQPSVMPEAIPFLDPIDEIVAEAPPKYLRSIHYVVAGMFVTLIVVTALLKVDVVVSGTGRIATETPPIMMPAIDRAILRELPIQAGDTVKKGQVLATLDPTFVQADLGALTAQQQAYQAQLRRLEAEQNGTPFATSTPPTQDELLQKALYEQRQAQYASRLRIFDEELQRRRANLRSAEDHRTSQAKQLEIARDVENMRSQMMQKQVGSRLNFLEAQASRMRIEQDLTDTVNRLSEITHDQQSKEAERQAFIDEWRHQLLDQFIATRTELAKVSEGIAKAALIKDLVVVTAPEDGVVLDTIRRGVGSIVREGEPLVTLIPANANLVADININSGDIGYTRTNDPVVVKVDAFPYQRHGFLKGRLAVISEESFAVNGTGAGPDSQVPAPTKDAAGAVHRGRVQLLSTTLEEMPEGARLIPGMTLTAEIKVGKRSVLSYFLNPLTRVFGESIREP